MVERAEGGDAQRALLPVEELARIAGVVGLDVRQRLVDDGQRELRRHGPPLVVLDRHDDLARLARLVVRTVVGDVDVEELARRRDDQLLAVLERLAVEDAHGAEPDVGDVAVVDGQADELDGAVEVQHLEVLQRVALDREQHPAPAGRRCQQEDGLLAHAHRVLVDEDLDAAGEVAELARRLVGDEHARLAGHVVVARVDGAPLDAIVAVGRRREAPARLAVRARRQRRLGHDLLLVAAARELPAALRLRAQVLGPGPPLPGRVAPDSRPSARASP